MRVCRKSYPSYQDRGAFLYISRASNSSSYRLPADNDKTQLPLAPSPMRRSSETTIWGWQLRSSDGCGSRGPGLQPALHPESPTLTAGRQRGGPHSIRSYLWGEGAPANSTRPIPYQIPIPCNPAEFRYNSPDLSSENCFPEQRGVAPYRLTRRSGPIYLAMKSWPSPAAVRFTSQVPPGQALCFRLARN